MLDKYVEEWVTWCFSFYFSQNVRFFKMLGTDEMRAWYGPDHVSHAADRGAIGTLLISDELFRYVLCNHLLFFPESDYYYYLFRASNPITRKKYVAMVEAVQQKGGEVVIFSSMHESGQRKRWNIVIMVTKRLANDCYVQNSIN
jgi:eRF1 domain 3